MNGLTVSLLGQFCIHCDDRLLLGLDTPKVQELFCYLLIFRDKPHSRARLAETLWSGRAQSRKYLRKELWRLQAVLESKVGPEYSAILNVNTDWIQLNQKLDVWLDVTALEKAFQQVFNVPGRELDPDAASMLQVTVALYQGDLLEACYADWCLLERERYRHMYLAILDKLMTYCEARDIYETGIDYGNLALRHDWARERTHRRLMRLYCLGGYRAEALRQYRHCVRALGEELGVAPTNRTRVLFEQICGDEAIAASSPSVRMAGQTATRGNILNELRQAQEILHSVELRLQ